MDKAASLLANSKISLREEDDGRHIVDADTNGLQIINPHRPAHMEIHFRSIPEQEPILWAICRKFVKAYRRTMVEKDVAILSPKLQGNGIIGKW